jgi:hypothetical protein
VVGCVAVVLALVLGSTVTWLVTDGLGARNRDRGNAAQPSESTAGRTADNAAALVRHDAATQLFEARSRAVLAHDKASFVAQIDPAAPRFRQRQATVFDRLAKVPLAAWEYDVSGDGPPLGGYQASLLPEGSFIARVVLRYTFAGSDSPVEREQFFTLVPRNGRWLLADDKDGGPGRTRDGFGEDLWELGPVTVVRGRSSLVIGAATAAVLRGYAREADRSVRDVRAVWKRDWSRRPVIIVPRTQADMARVIGTTAEGLEQIAAVTTGYSESGPTLGDRVVINPAAWRDLVDLGRRVVMTHEVTHLATRAATHASVPIWMSEGFADYVAYDSVDLPPEEVADDLLDSVRDGKGPKELPREIDFDPKAGNITHGYEGAWLATQMIADRYGERKLIELYVAMADPAGDAPEDDIRAVLGVSEQKLVKDWRAYLKSLANR